MEFREFLLTRMFTSVAGCTHEKGIRMLIVVQISPLPKNILEPLIRSCSYHGLMLTY